MPTAEINSPDSDAVDANPPGRCFMCHKTQRGLSNRRASARLCRLDLPQEQLFACTGCIREMFEPTSIGESEHG